MLTTNITITGTSTIDGTIAERYSATVNTLNPSDYSMSANQTNKTLYRENRDVCRADRAAFEEFVYQVVSEMEDTADEDTQ